MTSSKSTKRALLTSALAILMCVAMLIGTTFAWFTDSASTAVNKIQAGTLDVALEMSNDGTTWESAEGKTLTFKTTDNRAADQIQATVLSEQTIPKLHKLPHRRKYDHIIKMSARRANQSLCRVGHAARIHIVERHTLPCSLLRRINPACAVKTFPVNIRHH